MVKVFETYALQPNTCIGIISLYLKVAKCTEKMSLLTIETWPLPVWLASILT